MLIPDLRRDIWYKWKDLLEQLYKESHNKNFQVPNANDFTHTQADTQTVCTYMHIYDLFSGDLRHLKKQSLKSIFNNEQILNLFFCYHLDHADFGND